MDIVTDDFNNISITQLYSKLSQKQAQMAKLQEVQKTESLETSKDYYEQSGNRYDKDDFERVLSKFKAMDSEVRTHEQIHATIGPTTAPISYNYQKGPDGKMYAVGGSVRMDTSIPDDPKLAMFKLDQIQKSASGPASTSGADNAIAMQANLNKMLLQSKGDNDAN